jgi:hypothetical protein
LDWLLVISDNDDYRPKREIWELGGRSQIAPGLYKIILVAKIYTKKNGVVQ